MTSYQRSRHWSRDQEAARRTCYSPDREPRHPLNGTNILMRRPSSLPLLLLSGSLLLLLSAAHAAGPAAAPASESERLHRLFDLAWEDKLRQTPEFATYIGFPGHNDRWSDFSQAGIESRHALAREQLKALQSIDRSRLTAVEQVDLDLFRGRRETQIEGFPSPVEQTIPPQYAGTHPEAPRPLPPPPAATTRDYEDLLARLNALPVLVDQNV